MATNTQTPATTRTRNRSSKSAQKKMSILAARYMNGFSVAVTFSSGITQLVNFLPLFEKHLKGRNLKYFSLKRFQQFMVRNGKICWGKNEDITFPAESLFKKMPAGLRRSEDILYVM
ncbi:MAG TPA: hypothetical protein PK951_08380 [Chitinophagaceae bacterium]|nr:hypothetical protein [Chitinophagaceae bacterium]